MSARTSWSGEDDAHVMRALSVLWELEPDPRRALDAHDVVVVDTLPDCIGCVSGTPKKVFIARTSRLYQCAAFGDVAGLVVLLHHEAQHSAFGPDEVSAYAASSAFLQRTGLGELRPDLAEAVVSARDRALAKMDRAAFHSSETA